MCLSSKSSYEEIHNLKTYIHYFKTSNRNIKFTFYANWAAYIDTYPRSENETLLNNLRKFSGNVDVSAVAYQYDCSQPGLHQGWFS